MFPSLPCTAIMADSSEIVQYEDTAIPLFVRYGFLSSYPDMQALCHWHEDLEFIRVTKGQMNFHINGKYVLLRENDCLVVNSRQMHYGYSYHRQECEFFCILFHPSLFTTNKKLYKTRISPILEHPGIEFLHFPAHEPSSEAFRTLLDRIFQAEEQSLSCWEMEAIGLAHGLWTIIYRRCQEFLKEHTCLVPSDLTAQKDMVSYIYQHYTDKITLEDIAVSGKVCRSKCCSIFKHYMQQSPIDFLNTYRLEVSRRLLQNSAASITQIALTCGFNHLSYYSKLFYHKFGCTPSEYRNM